MRWPRAEAAGVLAPGGRRGFNPTESMELVDMEKEDIDPSAPTVEDELRAIWADVPEAEWNRLPADLTEHLDHYIYGTPK